ncbi:VOC family protein [Rhizorhabdus argentea]|uniref:VOC family protein n=1 Tax=Rhizorhabdus argentea TaxID=1387174 RepID=UPI0030EE39F4
MVWKARQILQLGYVVRSLEAAVDYFVDHQGVGPFYAMDVPPGVARYTYRGEAVEGVTKNRVAFGYRGPLQFELIESDNPVFDHLRGDKDIAYHHCMQMSDRFEADRAAYAAAGYATMGTGVMPGVLIHYIDTMEQLGHYTELFNYDSAIDETAGAMFKLFEIMSVESQGWGGQDRIRDLHDLPAMI